MSLKRDMLVEAGIEDKAVIDSLMNAYGSGIENAKTQAKSELQAENDSLKQQLEQQSQALNDLQAKEGASEEVKQQLTDLQAKFEAYKADSEANLAQVNKSNAIRLKETSPYLFKQEEQAAQPKISVGGNPSANANGITKEDFKRMGINERQELFDKDPELYQQLKG